VSCQARRRCNCRARAEVSIDRHAIAAREGGRRGARPRRARRSKTSFGIAHRAVIGLGQCTSSSSSFRWEAHLVQLTFVGRPLWRFAQIDQKNRVPAPWACAGRSGGKAQHSGRHAIGLGLDGGVRPNAWATVERLDSTRLEVQTKRRPGSAFESRQVGCLFSTSCQPR
jgi:hypothetical protein